MNGLGKNNNKYLEKEAGEGSLENNIKQLITDEAYSQISAKFPKLVPNIVGINIIEVIDNETAIGAAVLGVSGKKLLIPIVYSNGNVDAITFLYSEDDDMILALTKKVVSVIVSSSPMLEGGVPGKNEGQNFDIGDIHKLFVPPKTFSPKTASETGGLLFAVLEQSDLLKTALAEKLKDPEYNKIFSEIYGEEATSFVSESALSKEASNLDETESIALFNMQEIMDSEWLEKKAAMKEFALNGFTISQGINTPKYSMEKTASVATKLKAITENESLTTIDGGRPGIYNVYRMGDLKPLTVVISKPLTASDIGTPSIIYGPSNNIGNNGVTDGNGVIGNQKNISDVNIFKPFSTYKKHIGDNVKLIITHGGEIYGHIRLFLSEDKISKGLSKITISVGYGSKLETIVIENKSDASPVRMGSTLYVGSNNVKVLKDTPDSEVRASIVRVADLEAPTEARKLIKVAFDGAEFIYKNAAFSKPAIVNEFLNNGFDKASIFNLMKTATQEGSAEFAAINAKLDMLGNIVMNLAGQVQQVSASISAPAEEIMAPESQQSPGLATVEQPAIPQSPQDPALAMTDPNSGIQTQEQQDMMNASATQGVQADQQMLMQQGGQPQQDISGMNTAIDPQVLQTLSDLKDSNVMDVGVIATIASNSDISEVVSQYSGAIQAGASAVGRILLNTLVKKNLIIEQVGEPKYKQMINSLRSVFTKTSDLYVDITRLQLESDGKVAD